MGDVRNASEFFKRANTIVSQSANLSHMERKRFTSKARINDGLIYLAVDDFAAANASFDEVGLGLYYDLGGNVCVSYTFDNISSYLKYNGIIPSSSFECNRHCMN